MLVLGLTAYVGAQGGDARADYERANTVASRTGGKVYHQADAPNWIGTEAKFWYRTSVKGGNEFVLVDAAAATKAPAFDHAKLAAGINTVTQGTATAITLPFSTFTYTDNGAAIEFSVGGAGRAGAAVAAGAQVTRLRCSLVDYKCQTVASQNGGVQGAGRAGRGGGAPGPNQDAPQFKPSPDGKSEAFIQNFNVFVRPAGKAAEATALSWDGSEGNAYTFNSIQWAPDSKKIAAFRRVPGYNRQVTYVASSPTDQLQPKTSSRFYRKPGDTVDIDTPVVFDVAAKSQFVVNNALFPNPYANQRLEWRKDSRAFTFEYNQRGHQVYRVIEVDAATGKARAVIEETSKTFIDYSRTNATLNGSGRTWRFDVNDGKEVLWLSERDGWSHIYLYDGVTGQLKNQVTKGNWAVHHVEKVDEAKRQIYFIANGMDSGPEAGDSRAVRQDPYFLNWFRINFDGTGLTRFTSAGAMHNVTWSPDQQYYVDTYSRVDMPPVSELRRTSDQKLVLELEKADITDLTATGWQMPEVFTSKGRDGTTDIWGVIIRPTNFDPSKTYPVIENIYAGPQGSFVPKTFSAQTGMLTLAELGFIVVQVDGMGTANRSRAFHDMAAKNLGDAGFPDRILWHKAIAAKYPWYDITRVGIYGTSAGGQNSTGAVLFHPEFYKVAVSNSGCHDNRMDKIWWNEQWMGWPIGPEYAASSNVDNAAKLQGHLMLVVPELDTNVDPSSTMQVVNALVRASKEFELVVIPGADHGAGSPITARKRNDFFVRYLRGIEPPNWNVVPLPTPGGLLSTDDGSWSALDAEAMPWVASETFMCPQCGS
ncbi:MAG: S9 family peptidase [Acidobacteria bacterium]|nr:MAG: S9 family peptidase [Acidobacteriota bacterium]